MPAKKKPEAPIGLEIGTDAPNMAVLDETGKTVNLLDLAGNKGLALLFMRSVGWCAFCKKQTRLLGEISDEMRDAGWPVATLSYDSTDILAAFKDQHSLDFPLLSDESSAVIDAYALRNTRVKPDSRSVGVPHPAFVFIGNDGTVKHVLRETNYMKRPQNEDVLETARTM